MYETIFDNSKVTIKGFSADYVLDWRDAAPLVPKLEKFARMYAETDELRDKQHPNYYKVRQYLLLFEARDLMPVSISAKGHRAAQMEDRN